MFSKNPNTEHLPFEDELTNAIDDSVKIIRDSSSPVNPWDAVHSTVDPMREMMPLYTGVQITKRRGVESYDTPNLPPVEQFIEPLAEFSTRSPCPKCNTTEAKAFYC